MKEYLIRKLSHIECVHKILASFGYKIAMLDAGYKDIPPEYVEIYKTVKPYTMISDINIYVMLELLDNLQVRGISGSIVECGVWRGGAMLATQLRAKQKNDNRTTFLYDTYAGMSKPGVNDDQEEKDLYNKYLTTEGLSTWCNSPIDAVKLLFSNSSCDMSKLNFIKGKVEDTIPSISPDKIALLRLDTDWFSSTYHELIHLYDRVVPGGVVIIDDYGVWNGSRRAVDKFFSERGIMYHLHRIDVGARYFIKT